jgi:hypothetical protein
MTYQDRIVCFIDILGFSGHISGSIRADGSDAPEKAKELSEVLGGMREILNIDSLAERQDKEVTQFSDSVVISFPAYSESGVFDALLDIMRVQMNLVQRGYLCRGGIARGRLVHTPTMLFGPAMLEAYTLEKQAALYPRVILNVEIINTGVAAHAMHETPLHEQQSIMSLLKRDLDGMYYIDYITGTKSELDDQELNYPNYLFKLRTIISSGICAANPSVFIKYKWLQEKLRPYLLEVKESARTLPIGDELREAYENIPDL